MALHAVQLDQRQINAIALGIESAEADAERRERQRERSAWQRARDRLASRIVKELVTPQTATLDAALWAPLVGRAEADRFLHEAADRGAIFLDPSATEAAPSGLTAALRRFFGRA